MFSLVEPRSIPSEGGPTGVMRAKHEQGRNFFKAEKMLEATRSFLLSTFQKKAA